jgi:uncharacterized phage-associated protein
MKSPFTGGKVTLMQEPRELVFRKEKLAYVAHYYVCADSQEQFTTTELDELNLGQVYNQYRVKYGIPFPDEISEIRAFYGLSASKMSEILGLGANQYRLYEGGEMPSEAIGKLLKSILDPNVFVGFVRNAENQFSSPEFVKIIQKAEHSISRADEVKKHREVFGAYARSLVNGYAPQSYSRLKNIILYFIDKCGGVFNTKMNKLLFYTDFLSYKQRGVGMSGLAYRAIQYGPVPSQWNLVYGSLDDISSEIVAFSSGNSGERLFSEMQPDLSEFTSVETGIMDTVIGAFKTTNANDISEISHKEEAWIAYIGTKDFIDYNKAFSLKAL